MGTHSEQSSMSEGSRSLSSLTDSDREIATAHRLFDQGRFVEAAAVFKRYPQDPIARYLLGEAYERAPEYENCRHLAPLHYFGAVHDVPDFSAIRLAICYDRGLGVEESKSAAVHWYRIAGHSGVLSGYANAAALLWKGGGDLDRDRITAYACLFVASVLKDQGAEATLERCFAALTPEEEEEGYDRALTLMGERNLWRALCDIESPSIYSQDSRVLEAQDVAVQLINRL